MKQSIRRPIATLVMASVLALGLPAPLQAAESDGAVRERVELLLVARGVDAAQARARVAALTDEEAARIEAEIDRLPAGGNPFLLIYAAAVVVALVIMIPVGLVALLIKAGKRSRPAAGE